MILRGVICSALLENRLYTCNRLLSPTVKWNSVHGHGVGNNETEKSFSINSGLRSGKDIKVDTNKYLTEWKSGVDYAKLSDDQKLIHDAHMKAVEKNKECYKDPFTTFEVFTVLAHLNRGYCCGNACRHCPYKHVMVEAKYRDLKIFNTAYYS